MKAYLDNAATTAVTDGVRDIMVRVMQEDYGNPSSLHMAGMEAESYIRQAKSILAAAMRVQEKEIIFTSGGTESNNMAILGAAQANCRAGRHIITTAIEHPSVSNPMKYLEEQGFEVTYLPVDTDGVLSIQDLQQAIRKDTILISIMYINNEIGSIQPIEDIAKAIRQCSSSALFHVDGIQAFGKLPVYPGRLGIDLMSVSGHKIHGPKGIGFLYIRDKAKIRPLMYGGGQQNNLRSGTENVPGIAGLGQAVQEMQQNMEQNLERMLQYKDYFIDRVTQLEGVTVNSKKGRLSAPHIVSVSAAGIRSEVLLHALEERGVYVSAGSACSSNKKSVSATLQAIHLPKELSDSTVRFSFSVYTTKEELDYAVDTLAELLETLRIYKRK